MVTRLAPPALRSLAVALDAGVGLGTVLDDRALSALLPAEARATLSRALRAGRPPGQALCAAALLDEGEAAILDAGIEAGALPGALRTLADLMEEADRRRRRLLGAVAYPAFVLVAACVVLPLPAIVSGGVSAWARLALPGLVAIGAVMAIVFVVVPRSSPATRMRLRALLAGLPVVGPVIVDDARATGLAVLQRLVSSGMAVTLALPRALGATGLPRYSTRAAEAATLITRGGTLTSSLTTVGLVVGDVAARLEIAERTGTLDTALSRLVPELQEQSRRRFLALVLTAGVVLGVVVAVGIGWQIVSGFTGYLDTVDQIGRD